MVTTIEVVDLGRLLFYNFDPLVLQAFQIFDLLLHQITNYSHSALKKLKSLFGITRLLLSSFNQIQSTLF